MADITTMDRPQRWDSPFDPNMSDSDVEILLKRPEFSVIDSSRFPSSLPLQGILKNDCRLVHHIPGEIVVRDGDYGNSVFLVISGELTVVVRPGLPAQLLGRLTDKKKSFFEIVSQLWSNSSIPETRITERTASKDSKDVVYAADNKVSLFNLKNSRAIFEHPPEETQNLNEVPPLKTEYETAILRTGAIFGEIAALTRAQRTATVFSQTKSLILEIRWQGLRDIRKYDEGWRRIIDKSYRNNMLRAHLLEHPMFKQLDETNLQYIVDCTLFETYGSFEWYRSVSKDSNLDDIDNKDIIARQGEYTDGLLLIAGGFASVTMKVGNGERTLTYLRQGDYFGFDELYKSWISGEEISLETSLVMLGYLNVLRIPAHILNEVVFPSIETPTSRLSDAASRSSASDSLLEWAVENRYINGTQTMLINLDKCVRCDDCVTACANSHGGNPRFIRHGGRHGAYMVANACMHCTDPVCMIGCPTGAIHRSVDGGTVVINDDTCIGCATCATACPYENIRMVEIKNSSGSSVLDSATRQPILKATKCDLCIDQWGGPACVRACPHDALKRVDFRDKKIFAEVGN